MEQQAWKLEWSEELSVGIPEVDDEHKAFISLVNGLNHAVTSHEGLDAVRKWMLMLIDDAEQHFAHEEALFLQWRYPDAADHAGKHAEIKVQLRDIMAQFEGPAMEYEWIAAGLKIKDALVDHLLTEDMKYRDFRRSHPL